MTSIPESKRTNAATDQTADSRYRILLPLIRGGAPPGMFRFAQMLAQALGAELLILHVIADDDSESEQERLLPGSYAKQLDGVQHESITTQARTVADGIMAVARDRDCDLILLAWDPESEGKRDEHGRLIKLGHILDPVVVDAPCTVALLSGKLVRESSHLSAQRVLLATTGGLNTTVAAQLAIALARSLKGRVTLVTTIANNAPDTMEAKAYTMLDKIAANVGSDQRGAPSIIERRVIRADKMISTLTDLANDHDIVFLGASGDTFLNQLYLGSVAEQLAQKIARPLVVVRRNPAMPRSWFRRLWRSFQGILPSVSEEEGLDTYKRIRRGARANVNFYTLTLLSVVIATMGLLLNSGAVIIGAMLVAPLMTPILALGLGVVTGDTRLLKIAAQSTSLGILLAVVVSAFLAWLAPFALFTNEIASRTQPNLLDLTVALAAGAAGAFSVSRKDVAAALPGVAIAAALVPPLSVIGICLATARWIAAGGAALLFGSNLIAISLAAAIIYLLLGFVPEKEERARRWVLRYGLLASLVLLFAVTVPLARRLERDVAEATLNRTLRSSLEQVLNEQTNLSLFSLDWEAPPGQPVFLRVVVYARNDVSTEMLNAIDEAVSDAIARDVNLQLVAISTNEVGNSGVR